MKTRGLGFGTVFLLISIFIAPTATHAGCNLIAAAARELPASGLEGATVVNAYVDRPIAGPGDTVTLRADRACGRPNPGFALPGAGDPNQVTLRFRPQDGPTTDVAVAPASIRPIRCGPGACDALQFEIPDTSGITAGGLTGPTEIRVERQIAATTELVARVFELFQPTRDCDFANWDPDSVFGTFTVLPPPTVLATPSITSFQGALDGKGNLLLPIDFSQVLLTEAGAPVATILKVVSANVAIINALSDPTSATDTDDVRSFNVFGRPIPPLLRLTATNAFVGTTDVLRSVLQVRPLLDDMMDPLLDYQTLIDFVPGNRIGPVELLGADITVQAATPLEGLRSSLDVVAASVDELIVQQDFTGDFYQVDLVAQITDVATGLTTTTDQALTQLGRGNGPSALAAEGPVVAYLESEAGAEGRLCFDTSAPPCPGYNGDGDFFDQIVRIVRNQGPGLPPVEVPIVGGPISADPRLRVNGRALALSGGRAFFRTTLLEEAQRQIEDPTFASPMELADVAFSGPTMSGDGRYVAFTADIPLTGNNIYVLDRLNATTELASRDTLGNPADSFAGEPYISPNGRYVSFHSSDDLLPLTTGSNHIYVYDRQTQSVVRATTSPTGADADAFCQSSSSVSDNGRWVTYECSGGFGIPDAYAFNVDVYLKDMQTNALIRLNQGASGGQGMQGGSNYAGPMTPDGRYVVFSTNAGEIVPGVNVGGGCQVLYVYDRVLDSYEAVSRRSDGTVPCGSFGPVGENVDPAITPDGRYVAFEWSRAGAAPTEMVDDDTNGSPDVFVFDRVTQTVERVSLENSGFESDVGSFPSKIGISDDGRYVSFVTRYWFVYNDVPPGGSDTADAYVYDRLTDTIEKVSMGVDGVALGTEGVVGGVSISGDGRSVAFIYGDGFSTLGLYIRKHGPGLGNLDGGQEQAELRAVDTTAGTTASPTLADVTEAAVAGGRALALVQETFQGNQNAMPRLTSAAADADADDLVAKLYDPAGGTATTDNLGVAGAEGLVALSADVACVGVSEADQGPAGTVLNGDGAADDVVLTAGRVSELQAAANLSNVGVAVSALAAAGDRCVFLRPEAAEAGGAPLCAAAGGGGCDLNGDGDALDTVLHSVEVLAGGVTQLTNLGWAAEDLILSDAGGLVAFRTSEAAESLTGDGCLGTSPAGACDLNGDGDALDSVLQIMTLPAVVPTPAARAAATVSTGRHAIPCTFSACEAFDLYRLEETGPGEGQASFLGTEPEQAVGFGCLAQSPPGGCDLDGDGVQGGAVVHRAKVEGGLLRALQTLPANPDARIPPFSEPVVGQVIASVAQTECAAALTACPDLRAAGVVFGSSFPYGIGDCAARFDTDPDGAVGNPNDVAGALDCVALRNWIVGDSDRTALGVPDPDGILDVASNDVNDVCQETANATQADVDGDLSGDLVCDPVVTTQKPADQPCELDGKPASIDQRDVDVIVGSLGIAAAAADGWDARDRNGDGILTTFDSALCSLGCTQANCAQPAGGCGLSGLEGLLPLAWLAGRRRRRRS